MCLIFDPFHVPHLCHFAQKTQTLTLLLFSGEEPTIVLKMYDDLIP